MWSSVENSSRCWDNAYRPVVLVVWLVLIWGAAARAADTPAPADTTAPDTVIFRPDPALVSLDDITDTVNRERHLAQRPTVALFKSMVIPGWGQWGNRRYLKAAVVFGVQVWFIGSAVHFGRQAADFRARWEVETDTDRRRELYDLFDDRRTRRNKFLWFAGLTTFISMFDAYVDAHLSGKPSRRREDRLSLRVAPDPDGGAAIRLAFAF